jgi:CheY-like chemotaxis protein
MTHAAALRILLVDDDAATRSIIRRVLTRDFQCTIAEAADGLEALSILDADRFSMIVLDQQMPVMDGLDALEAIRASAQHVDVPVVMLTSEADERVVKRAVSLGISAYITKPVNPSRLSARFAAILEEVRRRLPHDGRQVAGPADMALDPARPLLVVDADPDFRHFVKSTLGSRLSVLEAETGSRAILQLMGQHAGPAPQIVLIGPSTGVLGGSQLVDKIRGLPLAKAPVCVGAFPRSQVDEVRRAGAYDAVLARTFIPETLLEQFARLTQPLGPLREFLRDKPQFRLEIITATAQVFGMMLSCEVEPVAGETPDGGRPVVRAKVELVSTQPELRLQFSFESSEEAARSITARMAGAAGDAVTQQDITGAIGEITSIIAGRLQNRLSEHGITTRPQVPEVTHGDTQAPPPQHPLAFSQWFRLDQGSRSHFRLALTEVEAG